MTTFSGKPLETPTLDDLRLHIDVGEHLHTTPSFTYGITPDFDVNLTIPLVRTFLRVTAQTQVPDPRLPQFTLPPGDANATQGSISVSDDAFGIGDVLLRAKYVFLRDTPVDLAAGLGISIPTGNENDFQGTGTTRVQPQLIVSRIFADTIEPLLNVGFDLNCDQVDPSVFRWALGATGQVWGPLTVATVFLARHEFSAQSDPIATPFFLQIERNDTYDASIGFPFDREM